MRIILIMLTVVLTSSGSTSSLVGHWKLNEGGGTIAMNSVLPTKNGTLTNGAVFAKMQKGNCVFLDGVNDYVNIPDANQYTFSNGSADKPFTISLWIYNLMASGAGCRIISKASTLNYEWVLTTRPTTGYYSLLLYNSAGTIVLANNTIISASADRFMWTMITATYDGSATNNGIKLYRNGINLAVTSANVGTYTNMSNTTAPVTVGLISALTSYGNLYAQDLRFYSFPLNETEVKNLYVETYNKISN